MSTRVRYSDVKVFVKGDDYVMKGRQAGRKADRQAGRWKTRSVLLKMTMID